MTNENLVDLPIWLVLYNRVINGRRFVVTENTIKNPREETLKLARIVPEAVSHFCGYMQLLPTDPEYKAEVINDLYKYHDHPFSSALGGITWIGEAPEWFAKKAPGKYIGFDTGHYGMGKIGELDVLLSVLHMRRELVN